MIGGAWCGRCPSHESTSRHRRSLWVNVAVGGDFCLHCHSHDDQLVLWAAAMRLPLHQTTVDFCHRLDRDITWIRRW